MDAPAAGISWGTPRAADAAGRDVPRFCVPALRLPPVLHRDSPFSSPLLPPTNPTLGPSSDTPNQGILHSPVSLAVSASPRTAHTLAPNADSSHLCGSGGPSDLALFAVVTPLLPLLIMYIAHCGFQTYYFNLY